jgi:hypothetical protein
MKAQFQTILIVGVVVISSACSSHSSDDSPIAPIYHNAMECPSGQFFGSDVKNVQRIENGIELSGEGHLIIDGREHNLALGSEKIIYRGGCKDGGIKLVMFDAKHPELKSTYEITKDHRTITSHDTPPSVPTTPPDNKQAETKPSQTPTDSTPPASPSGDK